MLVWLSNVAGCSRSDPGAPSLEGHAAASPAARIVEPRYAPRYYESDAKRARCLRVFGTYDSETVADIEGAEGRRVASYGSFSGGIIVIFRDGGRLVVWNNQIDCKDPPFDPLGDAEPAPTTTAVPLQEPRGEQAGQSPTLLAKAQAIRSPGFDCNKAKTQVEHMICADPELSAADRRMVELYQEVMVATMDKPGFKRRQDIWRETLRDSCRDVICLRDVYARRNEDIAELTAAQPDTTKSAKE